MLCKCIIVDDEPPAIHVLETYIESLPQLEIVGVCKNAFEAINLMNTEKVDLMFLDINMPKLMGTQLMKTLQHPPKVIFTTAHKDYAIEAFDLDAIDYLLKPISFERFLKAVNKFCNIPQAELESVAQNPGFVYFRADRKMVKVFLDDVLYIESFKDYVVIHRSNESPLRIKQTLNSVESVLPKHQFLRIHRSYIVSFNKITAFTKTDVEIGKMELPIGRSYSDVFKQLTPNSQSLPEGVDER
ncbi:LytTR family two component transcriptional regulator [Flavobacteriaceae bacterium MAR_2010_72]|nr:LytTR family two component transcriptional regulator [Flavobacteriaceae bacterium MAR_2010_72]TVZ59905.1 LytTR family two component transcriptional regulator [Flavobacteriaceae bacterium MAR_2010_105]